MPKINKPLKTNKTKASKPVKRTKKPVSRALVKSKPTKKTTAYFQCMSNCCQSKISPKKISQVAHECKTNALALNKQMSAQKVKDIKKLAQAFNEFKKTLTEHVKKY
jgi:hypothetical protein